LIGFNPQKLNPLERLRKAYRLCRRATFNIERSREQGRATRDKAEYLAQAILNLRDIQEEIERAGSELKQQTEKASPSSPE
jgi:hypothetical protein